MTAHTTKQFNEFMSQLKDTNATLDFFCDFDKINANVEAISMKLNQLNYLIGQQDMEGAIRRLWNENKGCFSVLDILIACRAKDKKKTIDADGNVHLLESYFKTVDGVIEFIRETGLEKVFKNKEVKNLVDYVYGVETGLDTNARKNRSGHQMEGTIASILKSKGVDFRQEVYSSEWPQLRNALGDDEKRFDFVVKGKKTYLIEVNFYSGGGSKLNEVARSYSDLGPKINAVPGFEFVWITDGVGWNSARNKLEEAFNIIPSIYNLTTIKDFINTL